MRLTDAPEDDSTDGPLITIPAPLLRGDRRLEALFAPFQECVVLHESLVRERSGGRATRLLMAEIRADRLDEVSAVVRAVGAKGMFEEKPTELDDVAAGTEWRERSGPMSVSAYRLFGGSTALHVRCQGAEEEEAPTRALLASPLGLLADLVRTTSTIELVSCTRSAGEVARWHLQASRRDMRRFEEIVPGLVALGFEDRRGKYWRERTIAQAVSTDRWMAATPGIDFGA